MSASIWRESAQEMVRKHGYAEALRLTTRNRDMNSEGTASFAFHNAVVKELRLMAKIDKEQP